MSSIPNAKMKHAHVHEEGHDGAPPATPPEPQPQPVETPTRETPAGHARGFADEAVGSVKEHPRTVAAIGAAVLAGAAALIGAPAIARAVRGDDRRKPAGKNRPAKK